jgi:hypothetical protein
MTTMDRTTTDPAVTDVRVAVYRFPTPETEGDGTLTWDASTGV